VVPFDDRSTFPSVNQNQKKFHTIVNFAEHRHYTDAIFKLEMHKLLWRHGLSRNPTG